MTRGWRTRREIATPSARKDKGRAAHHNDGCFQPKFFAFPTEYPSPIATMGIIITQAWEGYLFYKKV